ncbi:MAG: Sialic acid-specific 9-O-acetylesterase [Phycisphaerales bacterium]|nr:Sialic acid-specific 9-O-acetylesterase [Phycisphaerales bacterium]
MLISPSARRTLAIAALSACPLLSAQLAQANVKLPAVLADHMVLQQQQAVPVWGLADPGEKVTVSFVDQKESATADDKGKWSVKLKPLTASDKPAELTIAGNDTVTLKDILVGEVWICSGQSNMEMGIKNVKNCDAEVAAADHPNIRLFSVPKNVQGEPQKDIAAQGHSPLEGKWLPCTPQNIAPYGWGGFTAVGYFFGRDLHNDLKVPVGLIHTSWGGTPAESWTAQSYLEEDSDLRPINEKFQKDMESLPKQKEQYEKQMAEWKETAAKAKADGKPEPKKPNPPRDMAHDPWRPSSLYNGMIAPIVPFATKGAIWYQGESNAGRAYQYRKLLPAMIKNWREAWNEPEMGFYIVSLANFQNPAKDPGESDWAELREAQALTANQPHNGQAIAIDLADANNPGDIHPKDKQSVGHRLELVALAKSYGKSVDYSGPEYESSKVEGDKVRLKFKFADALTAKGGEPLKGFQIAAEAKDGEKVTWHWADAKIEGDSVIVSSKEIEKPAAVRYDWAHNPQGNLYNKADLPAVPFRTDNWPGVTAKNR